MFYLNKEKLKGEIIQKKGPRCSWNLWDYPSIKYDQNILKSKYTFTVGNGNKVFTNGPSKIC